MKNQLFHKKETYFFIALGIIIGALCVLPYVNSIKSTLSNAQSMIVSTTKGFEVQLQNMQTSLTVAKTQNDEMKKLNDELASELKKEKEVNDSFEKQIKKIAGTVGTLEKLSKTDEELLQKYSKVYFLNEHYIPSKLSTISADFALTKGKELWLHANVLPFLNEMIAEAKEDGVDLKVISGYRSFETQTDLKSTYKVIYGAGSANQFSADQGYSEHQLGTTVDITTPTTAGTFVSFENDPGYVWLTKNGHRFGFVLSYPKNNAYYQYEPWHWRFVGTDLAKDLHAEGKYFYDLDQRNINEYLVDIFD